MGGDQELVALIRGRLAAAGLSVRALGRAAGVSHSAISRLLAGHSRPTTGLLVALAPPLGCAAAELLAAAGRGPGADAWDALRRLGIEPVPPALVGAVRDQLAQLRVYAATTEARDLAAAQLEHKVAAIGAQGPVIERLRRLGRLYLAGEAPEAIRLAAGSAVLYFLTATDAISDFLFPVGYLDDAVAIALAEAEIERLAQGP